LFLGSVEVVANKRPTWEHKAVLKNPGFYVRFGPKAGESLGRFGPISLKNSME
jgi:hypothetical protein